MAEKTYAVRILDPAQGELEEIAQLYLSLSGVQSARSGPSMRETELRNLGYRFLVAEKYIIIYRLIGDTVYVYHIFDGRSDYPTLFRSELFK